MPARRALLRGPLGDVLITNRVQQEIYDALLERVKEDGSIRAVLENALRAYLKLEKR